MRFSEIINEAVTASEFKFGFEFECLLPENVYKKYFVYDQKFLANLPVKLQFETDETVKGKDGETSAEFISEPMLLNPKNILASKSSIVKLLKDGCYTNSTCGFHIHFSTPSLTYGDICWILIVLSSNADLINTFTQFKEIPFFNCRYADKDLFEKVSKCFVDGIDYASLSRLFNQYKYHVLRIHPQGTLEWRGPRDFMNSANLKNIDDFFLHLYRAANVLSYCLGQNSVTLEGTVANKHDIVSYFNENKELRNYVQNMKYAHLTGNRFAPEQDRGLLEKIFKIAPWLSKADFEHANIALSDDGIQIVWKKGVWSGGIWNEGVWENGTWLDGTWLNGTWHDGEWINGYWHDGEWINGYWHNGVWKAGIWRDGDWVSGVDGENVHHDTPPNEWKKSESDYTPSRRS